MLTLQPELRVEMGDVLVQIVEMRLHCKLGKTIERQERSMNDLQLQTGELRGELLQMNENAEKERIEPSSCKTIINPLPTTGE